MVRLVFWDLLFGPPGRSALEHLARPGAAGESSGVGADRGSGVATPVRVHAGYLYSTIGFWPMPVVQGTTATDQSSDSIEVDRSHQTAGQGPKIHLLKPPHLIDRHTRLWALTEVLDAF